MERDEPEAGRHGDARAVDMRPSHRAAATACVRVGGGGVPRRTCERWVGGEICGRALGRRQNYWDHMIRTRSNGGGSEVAKQTLDVCWTTDDTKGWGDVRRTGKTTENFCHP